MAQVKILLLSIGIAVLAACGSNPANNSAQRVALEERAAARWTALSKRDWNTAYSYTSPAYRSVISQNLYRQKFSYQVEWELTSVEFLNYDRAAAVASVRVRVMSRAVKQTNAASAALGSVPTGYVEQWVLRDGQWWYSSTL